MQHDFDPAAQLISARESLAAAQRDQCPYRTAAAEAAVKHLEAAVAGPQAVPVATQAQVDDLHAQIAALAALVGKGAAPAAAAS